MNQKFGFASTKFHQKNVTQNETDETTSPVPPLLTVPLEALSWLRHGAHGAERLHYVDPPDEMSLTREFFKRIIPEPIYNAVRNALLFRPDDHNRLWQQPPQMRNKLPGYDEVKGYRYPAPGSVPRPNVSGRLDDPFDNKRYSRNLDNLDDYEQSTILETKYGTLKLEPSSERVGSKGANIPAVFRYDETGLRSTNTATWEAMEKELMKIRIDHLPQNGDNLDEMLSVYEAHEEKGRPIPSGPVHKWERVSSNYNNLRW